MIETFYIAIIPTLAFLILFLFTHWSENMNDMNLNTYTIEQIAEDCFDLYVSGESKRIHNAIV